MRNGTFMCVGLALVLTAVAANLKGDSGKETANDKIDRLIKQLGDSRFAKREAASKELGTLGEPALAALRKAAASGADAEIQRRAEQAVRAIIRVVERFHGCLQVLDRQLAATPSRV